MSKRNIKKDSWYVYYDEDGQVTIEKSFPAGHDASNKAEALKDHLRNEKNHHAHCASGVYLAKKYPEQFLAESFLGHLMENSHLDRLNDLSSDDVKNAFLANYLAALIFLKTQDIQGLHLINDHEDAKMPRRFANGMSDISFWARALFSPEDAEVKTRLQSRHASLLQAEAGRIMDSRVDWLLKIPSTAPEHVDWEEVINSLLLLRHRFSINSSYLRTIALAIFDWESVSDTTKRRAINAAFMYLMQSDPKSALLSRMRAMSSTSMLGKMVGGVIQKVIGYKKLHEEDGGGGAGDGGAGTTTGNVGTTQNAIIGNEEGGESPTGSESHNLYRLNKLSPFQVTKKGKYLFRGNKVVKKRKKKFKFKKFTAPAFMLGGKGSGEK